METDIELSHASVISQNDEDDIFTRLSITSEKFIQISNRIFDLINGILAFILLLFLIANQFDYNFFPFSIKPANSWLYQVAQIVFIISYLTKNILTLRLILICGNILFMINFSLNGISIDFLIYTCFAITINLKNIFELLYKKRPIIFDKYREQIYKEIFQNFMTRDEFALLTKYSLIRDLQPNVNYCHPGDKCNNLSILIYGKLQIIGKNDINTFIIENQFIDSAEWILRKSTTKKGKRFNNAIRAVEKCKYMFWPREILLEKLHNKEELEGKLMGALGLDVSHKILSIQNF